MPQIIRKHQSDLLIALGLLLLPLALFWPVTLGGRTLLPADNLVAVEPWKSAADQFGVDLPHNQLLDDLVLENYPWKKFILESLAARQLPLWNPYLFAGLPFLAAGQHSALYPFSLIFYVAPLWRAYGLFTWSQFFLAGLCAYVFLRVLGLRRLSATFGAIVYELCLFMVVSVVFPMIVAGAVWLPLILTAVELVVRQHPGLGGRPTRLPWLALGSGALGVQVLAGHVEITYYTVLVAAGYAVWRLVGLARSGPREPGVSPARGLARPALALLALAALGLALGAVQLIPLYDVVRQNFRSGSASFEQIMGWAYPWRHAVAFLIPNFYGNPSHHGYFDLFDWRWTAASANALGQRSETIDWGIKNYVEGGAYVGLLPLLLSVLSIYAWARARRPKDPQAALFRNPHIPFFALLGGLALAFAFPTRLYALIFWLPGINQLHSPFRWVWPFALSAAVLTAYGIEYLRLGQAASPPTSARARRAQGMLARYAANGSGPAVLRLFLLGAPPAFHTLLGGLAFWCGSLLLVAVVAARVWYDRIAGWMDRLVFDLAKADQAFVDGRMFFSYEARWIVIFAALLVASGIALRLSACRIYIRARPVWQPVALAVLAVDLLAAGWGFNPAADPSLLEYVPPSVDYLRRDDAPWRFTTYDTAGCRRTPDGSGQPCKPFNANLGWYFNLEDVRGYDSIFSQQYKNYMELIQPQYELDFNRIAPISDPTALDSPLLDLLNVQYVISQEDLQNPKYTLVYEGEVKIYRNATALPRAFTLPLAATLVSEDFGVAAQSHDPRRHVIVGPEVQLSAPLPGAPAPAWPDPVAEVLYPSVNEVIVTAAAEVPAWMVLVDSYAPGWRAYRRPLGADRTTEQEVPIALVNGNFRGVQLPRGEWVVRFKYTPDSVKLGGIVSFAAAVTLVFGLAVWAWRYFYRDSAVDSTARRVAKNSLAPMALNLMNRGIDLIFAAFYLRVLGPDDVGKYSFAIVVFGWFEIITNFGLNTLLTRDVSRDRAHANRYLVNTTLLRLLLGALAVPGLVLVLGLRQLLPNPLTADTLWAIGLLVAAQAPATIATGLSALFYVYEKAEYPAAVSTISTLLKVVLGTVALVLGWGFVGLAGASIVVNLATLIILGVLVVRLFLPSPRWELDWDLQRHAVRESFPLMLNHLLATLFFKVDVPMLETIRNQQEAGRGNREVGWYRTAYMFVDAFNVIPAFFTFALFPVMSRQAQEDRPALRRSYVLAVKLLLAVALPLATLTSVSAPLLVGMLGGEEFLPFGAIALSIMVWSIPFGWINSVTNYLLIALDQQRRLTYAFALALAFNVGLNLILIPIYGYPAAAATTIASEFFEGLAFYWILRRALGPVPWLSVLWRMAASAALMVGLVLALRTTSAPLALVLGLAAYGIGLLRLGAFTAGERDMLITILPTGVRSRLKLTQA